MGIGQIGNVISGQQAVQVQVSLPQQQLVELAVYLFIAFLLANVISGVVIGRK